MVEKQFAPDWFSSPGSTVSVLMAKRSLTPAKLAQDMGCDLRSVRALLSGGIEIDADLATKLAFHLGGTPSFWQKRSRAFHDALKHAANKLSESERSEWVKNFNSKKVEERGWLNIPSETGEYAKSYLAYFNVAHPKEWNDRYAHIKGVSFRTSASLNSKVGPLTTWLRQGEIEASFIKCAKWDKESLRRKIPELRRLSLAKAPTFFAQRIRNICASTGVAVVFVRAPDGCRASGATKFLSKEKALIIASFRHLSEDHFWFTFFHEIGHLLLHSESSTFVDEEGDDTQGKTESEANAFAARVLVPQERYEEMLDLRANRESIMRFAVSIGTSPGIVVGQLQKSGVIKPSQLNFLKRRYTWVELENVFNL